MVDISDRAGVVEQVGGEPDGLADVVVVGPQLEGADDEHPLHAAEQVVVGDGLVGSELGGRPDEVERRQPPGPGDVGGLGGLEVGGGAAQHREVVRGRGCVERIAPSELAEHVPLDADQVQHEVAHRHVVVDLGRLGPVVVREPSSSWYSSAAVVMNAACEVSSPARSAQPGCMGGRPLGLRRAEHAGRQIRGAVRAASVVAASMPISTSSLRVRSMPARPDR